MGSQSPPWSFGDLHFPPSWCYQMVILKWREIKIWPFKQPNGAKKVVKQKSGTIMMFPVLIRPLWSSFTRAMRKFEGKAFNKGRKKREKLGREQIMRVEKSIELGWKQGEREKERDWPRTSELSIRKVGRKPESCSAWKEAETGSQRWLPNSQTFSVQSQGCSS